MKTKIIILITLLAMVSEQALAIQCILPDVVGQPENNKQVEVVVADNDIADFNQASRKCGHYFPYYEEGFKSIGAHVPTQAECLADPSIINLSQGFAPFGAFFRSKVLSEGSDTNSSDSSIKGYKWEIRGPTESGNPLIASYDSFNAAYIFEEPGTYTAKLTVTFNDNSTATDEKEVTVWPRSGKTFYVDANLGDDRNDGLSQTQDTLCDRNTQAVGTCSGPWRTATRGFSVLTPRIWPNSTSEFDAFSGCSTTSYKSAEKINGQFYSKYAGNPVTPVFNILTCDALSKGAQIAKPGDRVLFKRGQRFKLNETFVSTSKYTSGGLDYERFGFDTILDNQFGTTVHGLLFAAYGSGSKPLIARSGSLSYRVFAIGSNTLHLAFQDLDFDLESPDPLHPFVTNKRSNFLMTSMTNLVMNHTSIRRTYNGPQNNGHGFFVKDSSFYNALVTHINGTANDVAFINNKFDYAYNHLVYVDFSNSLITGNTFSRPAWGRTALRITGSDPTSHRAYSNWVANNIFEGWKDPRKCSPTGECGAFFDGKRYTYSLVEFHTNTSTHVTFHDRLVFKRNVLKNAETLLKIGDVAHALVEDNIFDNKDNGTTDAPRLFLHSAASSRPLNDITLRKNLFVERSPNLKGSTVTTRINTYTASPIGVVCDDLTDHQNISVKDNQYYSVVPICAIGKSTLTSSNNIVGINPTCMVNTTQTASETLATTTGFTATSNQVNNGADLAAINQAVANKKAEIAGAVLAPVVQPVDTKPTAEKTPVIKNLKKKK